MPATIPPIAPPDMPEENLTNEAADVMAGAEIVVEKVGDVVVAEETRSEVVAQGVPERESEAYNFSKKSDRMYTALIFEVAAMVTVVGPSVKEIDKGTVTLHTVRVP